MGTLPKFTSQECNCTLSSASIHLCFPVINCLSFFFFYCLTFGGFQLTFLLDRLNLNQKDHILILFYRQLSSEVCLLLKFCHWQLSKNKIRKMLSSPRVLLKTMVCSQDVINSLYWFRVPVVERIPVSYQQGCPWKFSISW